MVIAPKRYMLSVNEYDAAIKAGAFREDARIELFDGELIEKPVQGIPHVNAVRRLNGLVYTAGVEPGTVLVQQPIHLNWNSEPEPDLVLLRPPSDRYDFRHAEAGDVLLLIEVAESSLLWDLNVKVPRYAEAGIPEVWLVDLVDDIIRVFRQPVNGVYQSETSAARGERVTCELFSKLNIEVAQILG